MKLGEAISRTDINKPNAYDRAEKIAWLSSLDGVIKAEIIDTHEDGENVVFSGYTEDTDPTVELIVPEPYDEIYLRYLEMKIDYANGEYKKYNNSKIMYNEAFSAFKRYYNRQHVPKDGANLKFF